MKKTRDYRCRHTAQQQRLWVGQLGLALRAGRRSATAGVEFFFPGKSCCSFFIQETMDQHDTDPPVCTELGWDQSKYMSDQDPNVLFF